jgi:hypothetical protein
MGVLHQTTRQQPGAPPPAAGGRSPCPTRVPAGPTLTTSPATRLLFGRPESRRHENPAALHAPRGGAGR